MERLIQCPTMPDSSGKRCKDGYVAVDGGGVFFSEYYLYRAFTLNLAISF